MSFTIAEELGIELDFGTDSAYNDLKKKRKIKKVILLTLNKSRPKIN